MEAPKNAEKTRAAVPNFPKLEEDVLDFWDREQVFQKSLEKTETGKRFVFFEGPPTANGLPGIHHVLARTFKDIIVRYKSLRGFFVERKAGWDTHGLPVEIQVEKALKLSGKKQIEEYGIEKFNAKCKESVLEYKKDWEALTRRIGFWLDMEHPYLTYSNEYIESLWWIVKQVWDKGLLYKGHKVVPHCPRCGTALSSHEVAQGYRDVTEDSVYVKFKVKGRQGVTGDDKRDMYLLSWTTTPWTLPGNVALAVGENIEYVIVDVGDETVVLASSLAEKLVPNGKIIKKLPGSELVGLGYEQLFDIPALRSQTSHKVYAADFVNTEEGTGIVHTAVMYGEDDYALGEKVGLPKHHTVHRDGTFTDEVPKWAGKFVKDAEKDIVEELRSTGKLYNSVVPHLHSYPFCWRCETPLLYYAKDSWFIAMSKLRDQLIANNGQINWVPAHIKDGRFGEWLKDVKDWAFSRERYWGTPMPVWVCEECGKQECVGSIEQLKACSLQPISQTLDLHRPFVDEIKLKCPKCSGTMFRVPEVIDVWFDSGSMPFAQWHYPFENKDRVEAGISFPADYISEAIDQTRGWFYTLLAISTLLDKGAPYKNVICLGHILDAKGQKMSKSKGNILKPADVISKFGADPIRMYLATMNPPGEPKRFDLKGLDEVVRKYFLTLWNVLEFYRLYAQERVELHGKPAHVLDRYILARKDELAQDVERAFDAFDVYGAGRKLASFVTELSTWYVRRSRDRFKAQGPEREQAVGTLGNVLEAFCKLTAPITPMYAEILWQRLKHAESVHLAEWPVTASEIDEELLQEMKRVKAITELGHALRAESGLRVRQPLTQCIILGKRIPDALIHIVADELNVKEVNFASQAPTGKEFTRKNAGELTVLLDTTLTDELLQEGMLRDVIRHINALRKEQGFTISDRARIQFATTDQPIAELLHHFEPQILSETLSTGIAQADDVTVSEPLKLRYGAVRFALNKA